MSERAPTTSCGFALRYVVAKERRKRWAQPEGADYSCQTDCLRDEGQGEADRESEDEEDPVLTGPHHEPDDWPGEPVAEPDRDPEERDRLEDNPRDRERGEP
jgi:hypothetical protein